MDSYPLNNKDQILVIAPTLPYFDRSSWGVRLFNIIKILSQEYKICYLSWSTYRGISDDNYINELSKLGVVVFNDVKELKRITKEYRFSSSLIEYYSTAEYFLPRLRILQPDCPIIVDSVDVHYNRLNLQAKTTGSIFDLEDAKLTKKSELAIYSKADLVIVVSEDDQELLKKENPALNIEIIPNIHDIANMPNENNKPKELIFIGSLKFAPNLDAIKYYCNEILPLLRQKNPEIHLSVIGHGPFENIKQFFSESVSFVGYVLSITPYLNKNIISIAPLRFGGGIKGKITEAMSHGIPVVTTSIGVQGMNLKHRENIMIADTPLDFVDSILSLAKDKELYNNISKNSLDYAKNNFSLEKNKPRIIELFKNIKLKRTTKISRIKATFFFSIHYIAKRIGLNNKPNEISRTVLFVHGNNDTVAGQELSLVSRIKGLSNLWVCSKVILPGKGIFYDFLRDNGIAVNFIPLNRLSKKNPFPFLMTFFSIFYYIKKNRISLIHCSGVYPTQYCLPAAKLARIPCITHVNSTIYSNYDLKSSFIKYADAVIAVSEAAKKNIEELINHKHNNWFALFSAIAKQGQHRNHFMIYDAIHQDQNNIHNINNLKEKFNITTDTKIVGQIGQIIPRKGIKYFILMAKIVKQSFPKVKFMLIGDSPTGYGQYNEQMQNLVLDNHLEKDVIFTGYQRDIHSFLEILDVNVLASLVEGLPRVVVEAMLMAKPNVCTDIDGTNEVIVTGYSGLLVPPGNHELLAKAVLELLLDEEKAKLMGERGKKFVSDKFNESKHAEQLLKIYGIVLNKRLKLKIPDTAIR